MLRFPSTPIAPQIIEAEKYVCPPWLHPLSCMNDPRLMVPSSVASNGDHAWEELKKSKVLWFLLPLPLMFLWDYMKQISEAKLPHQRKKNPIELKFVGVLTAYVRQMLGRLNTLDQIIEITEMELAKKDQDKEKLRKIMVNTEKDKFKEIISIIEKDLKNLRILKKVEPEVYDTECKKILQTLTKKEARIIMALNIKSIHKQLRSYKKWAKKVNQKVRFKYYNYPAQKNPSSRCTYQAVVRFKRGDTVKTADMMLDAWSLTEAKSKFHDILDKKLKNATLESLHVERVLC